MSTDNLEPLSELSGFADSDLGLALRAARQDVPSTARVEKLLAAFPLGPGPGGAGSSGGGDACTTGGGPGVATATLGKLASVKVAVGLAVAAGIGIGGLVLSEQQKEYGASDSGSSTAEAPERLAITPSEGPGFGAALSSAPTAAVERNQEPAMLSASNHAAPAMPEHPASAAAAAPDPAPSPRSEVELLREAQAALASNPKRALELTNAHARNYPSGVMSQEREMVRINALVATGRTAEARAAAARFRKAYPKSAYLPRVESLVSP